MSPTPSRRLVSYVECKTYGHSWDEYNPSDGDLDGWAYRLTLRCTRCTTTRHDYLDKAGELGRRHYSYPDGYRDPKEQKRKRPEMRLLIVVTRRQRGKK